jgi:DNA-binding Lrp family transcriptional regulator
VQPTAFDERDLKLIHALQIAPRISWAEAARILGSTPITLANRWERMRSEGLAWVGAHPSGLVDDLTTGFVEVDCAPGRHAEAIAALRQDPRAVTIEQSARGRDLLLTVMTPDLASFSRFVLDDLPRVPGVERQRAFLSTQIHRQGRDWRLNALDREEQAAFEGAARQMWTGEARPPADAAPLIHALSRDGRASAAELARATGRNPATVRRQLTSLLRSGVLSFRCEVAQDVSMWALQCTWLARVPQQEKERTVAALITLPELRLCVSTTGETNLYVSVWARSQSDLLRLESLIGEKLPWLAMVESVINLRTAKRMGWFIDERGRATGEVVVPNALDPDVAL